MPPFVHLQWSLLDRTFNEDYWIRQPTEHISWIAGTARLQYTRTMALIIYEILIELNMTDWPVMYAVYVHDVVVRVSRQQGINKTSHGHGWRREYYDVRVCYARWQTRMCGMEPLLCPSCRRGFSIVWGNLINWSTCSVLSIVFTCFLVHAWFSCLQYMALVTSSCYIMLYTSAPIPFGRMRIYGDYNKIYACISGHSGHRNEKEVSLPHSAHRRKRFGRARTGGDTNIGNHSVLIDVEIWQEFASLVEWNQCQLFSCSE
jgi:hypothetical protein